MSLSGVTFVQHEQKNTAICGNWNGPALNRICGLWLRQEDR